MTLDECEQLLTTAIQQREWYQRKLAEMADGTFWHYQGTEDELESLNCPIIIEPKQLLGLLTKLAECEGSPHTSRTRDMSHKAQIELLTQQVAECEAEREAAQKRFKAASELSAARGVEISKLRDSLAECEREKAEQPAGFAQLTEVLCSDNLDSDAIVQDCPVCNPEAGEQEKK